MDMEVILPLPEARVALHCTERHCYSLDHRVPKDPRAKGLNPEWNYWEVV